MSKSTLVLLDANWSKEQVTQHRGMVAPTIFIGKKTCRLNVRLATLMAIKKGDRILLAQDPKFPKDFYLLLHPNGFPCTVTQSGEVVFSQSLYIKLMRAILDAPDADKFKFKVSAGPDIIDGQTCFAVNTVFPLLPAADATQDQALQQTSNAQ